MTEECYRVSISDPLTGIPHTLPAYTSVADDGPAGESVPVSVNPHGPAVPAAVQLTLLPEATAVPLPLIVTPAQVAP